MIAELSHHGASPALERLVQFTEARQGVLAHSIANLSTPHFRPADLPVDEFQRKLGAAIDRRRARRSPQRTGLTFSGSGSLRFGRDRLEATPIARDENVLFHDRNNRDLDRLMQDLAENQMAHGFAITMLRRQFASLNTAIRERL
ncbi:flagellar basal body rod protein FlgB [Phycisphaera mikurensis]|uniref:Putative flagellar basal-body rod protein FlgB n=1 Tax=Phycisphaera mikurensis (strain NBRC 102666 / KCTC 22515 / FYK2301M01) TaxID=1142394 RepID=I0IGE8_PHYMF|nr:flagellar biosynthesis protein FlgB [Phycisphaera mikurensis]MBB6440286.1 flagellar basal-body rod protein FlgB [Phycisphaera mikurensis]BAM04336.1 putative flagellar basal-body rod protein FlgB [Phycisphaera mikurensis NBRC 102666]